MFWYKSAFDAQIYPCPCRKAEECSNTLPDLQKTNWLVGTNEAVERLRIIESEKPVRVSTSALELGRVSVSRTEVAGRLYGLGR